MEEKGKAGPRRDEKPKWSTTNYILGKGRSIPRGRKSSKTESKSRRAGNVSESKSRRVKEPVETKLESKKLR